MDVALNEHRIYSTAERQNAVDHARRVVAAGGTIADAARELSVPVKKLYRWREPRKRPVQSGRPALTPFVPVKVIEATQTLSSCALSGPVVMGGHGVRVERLSIQQIADLLRALG